GLRCRLRRSKSPQEASELPGDLPAFPRGASGQDRRSLAFDWRIGVVYTSPMHKQIRKGGVGAGMSLLACLLGETAAAHHGLANFNLNLDITVSGTIKEIALINPHSWI